MGFLDQVKAEWHMLGENVATVGQDLADEMNFDFDGHNELKQDRQPVHYAPVNHGMSFSRSFVNGWYAARNPCAAQGSRHGYGRQLGPEFDFGPQGGPGGPSGPGYGY